MTDYCAFNKNHKCIKWSDHELTRHELEEADELCHGNFVKPFSNNFRFNRILPILKLGH